MKISGIFWCILFSACGLLVPLADGRCQLDEDCTSLESCQFLDFEENGFCVGNEINNPLVFAIDITPPPNSGFVRTQEFLPSFSESLLFLNTLPLKQEVSVLGRIVVVGKENSPLVQIIASNQEEPLIAGTGREVFSANSDEKGFFTLFLRPGRYDLVATPVAEANLPPIVLRDIELGASEASDLIISFEGERVLRGSITSLSQELDSMKVVAHAVSTKDANEIDPDIRSTSAVTKADGTFEILLPKEGFDFVLRIEPLSDGPNALIPSALFPFDLETILPVNGVFTLDPIELGPKEESVFLAGKVNGTPSNPKSLFEDAEEGTSLLFTRQEIISAGRSFSRLVEVDEFGQYLVELLPGTYDISITSPSVSEFASGEFSGVEIDCEDSICEDLDLILARRHKIFGQIFTPAGKTPEESVSIEARVAGQTQGSPIAETSDELGRGYEITLDPGVYDLTFTPSPSSGLAPWFLFNVDIQDSDAGADLFLLPSSLLVGGVISSDAAVNTALPVEARIQVFAQTLNGDFYRVGTTNTNDFGQFFLALPNPENFSTDLGLLAR